MVSQHRALDVGWQEAAQLCKGRVAGQGHSRWLSMIELNDDFSDMIQALTTSGVDFLIVGAYALSAHGIVRATEHIDLLVRAGPDNAERVMKALSDFGAPIEMHGICQADFEKPGTVYQIGLPPRRIDILTSISGVTYDEAQRDCLLVRLAGQEVHVIGRQALLTNKRSTGRLKDLADAERLAGVSGESEWL